MRKAIVLLGMFMAVMAHAQRPQCTSSNLNASYIDSVNNVQYLCTTAGWKANVGIGAPAVACSAVNYGATYTDVSTGIGYQCGSKGWVQGGGSSSVVVGSVGNLVSPETIDVVGNYAYVTGDPMGFAVVDVSNVSAPKVLGRFNEGCPMFGHYTIYPLVYLSIAGCGGTPGGIQIVNVSDPNNITLVGSVTGIGGNEGIVVKGNNAYVANQPHTKLVVYDVSNPASPSVVTEVVDAVNFAGMQPIVNYGNYLYVTSATGLVTIDITTPTAPVVHGELVVGTSPAGMVVSGTNMYVTNNDYGLLTTVSLATPASPAIIGSVTDQRLVWGSGAAIIGNVLYSTSFNTPGMVTAVDVTDPTKPYVISALIETRTSDFMAITSSCNSGPNSTYIYCGSGFLGSGGNSLFIVNTAALIAPSLLQPFPGGQFGPGPNTGPVYSKNGVQLFDCQAGSLFATASVSDASSLTPGTTYTPSAGAGAISTNVQCTLTGSTYAWKTM